MCHFDIVYRYTKGLESGAFDKDLSAEERAVVVSRLRAALRLLGDFGAMSREDLYSNVRDPWGPPEINQRVREILFGCMSY